MDCKRIQSTLYHSKNWKYDVFVSFRGETRNNFTDHLFDALRRHGILAFRDDTKLEKGGPISAGLLQAIEGSQVLIVVFSMDYASSTWCLQELAQIADCIQIPGHRVLPVFYNVSPSEVRKQSGNYEKAFMEHEERFKDDAEMMEQVLRWRAALTQVANLSGWDVKDKSQSAEIENIVKVVTSILSPKSSSSLSNDIVGMHSPVQELEKLLVLDSDDDVRVVGICGMGGIGKSTLATILYEKISHQYDASCFVDDVSRIYGGYGPLGVQKQLLCQAFIKENFPTCNRSLANNLIQNRLRHRKVLIVLDNVDQGIQLEKLAIKREWLGRGSRMIIVTRDEHILREYGVDEVYKVQLLNDENALQLFCRKAFKCNHVAKDYENLTNSVLTYANGLPLAIRVLGSFLFGRDVSEWSSALVRLKENPTKDIMDVLRISFDGLENMEKEIFLDIACFFHNEFVGYVKDILNIRGFYADIGIRILIDKSLITCNHWGWIVMHDLLQELGRSIVREKSPKEPGKWSRLWDQKDLRYVQQENKDLHNLTHMELCHSKNLVKIPNLSQAPNLEHLDLEGCVKLVHLDASTGSLEKLHFLNLKNCKSLVSIPNSIFGLNSLYDLNLSGCKRLFKYQLLEKSRPSKQLNAGQSVERHMTSSIRKTLTRPLQFLSSRRRANSVGLLVPSVSHFPALVSLDISFCNLIQIPDAIGLLCCLEDLNIGGNNFVTLPHCIKELPKLTWLNLEHCKHLKWMPSTLLPIRGGSNGGIFVYNCPNLSDTESCRVTVISWMIKMIQVNMQCPLIKCKFEVVIPGNEIPRWFKKQNTGDSVILDPYPILDDNDWIGIACCGTFVAHHDPTQLFEETIESQDLISFGFRCTRSDGNIYSRVPICLKKDLITTEVDHMLLSFISQEVFINYYVSHIKEGASDLHGVELHIISDYPEEVVELKRCGYRWVFKEDLEQFNPTMMFSANSSVQSPKHKFLAIQDHQ
ncbi:disease resistance protein RUN1-like isoform X3 [Arachis stenosperma]|uniref:disease resistance protein RUN1-like isoform X3 n=1 Tax=Arachis stenosperma TaxID=217475 RepID=UPI0025AC9857|nr:disease resistance protein RUN1-like isoform X3 [Arachis stenosperma]